MPQIPDDFIRRLLAFDQFEDSIKSREQTEREWKEFAGSLDPKNDCFWLLVQFIERANQEAMADVDPNAELKAAQIKKFVFDMMQSSVNKSFGYYPGEFFWR